MENKCPKCGAIRKPYEVECLKCGIIYEKFEKIQKRKLEKRKGNSSDKKTMTPKKSINRNLTECKDCGQSISKNAVSCPNCGASVKQKKSGCAIFLILIFLGVM